MSRKIDNINFRYLRSSQSLDYLMDCKKLTQNDEKVSEKFATLVTALGVAVDEFDQQLKNLKANALTKQVKAARQQMSKAFSVLSNLVTDMKIYSPSEAAAQSTHRLQLLFGEYQIKPRMEQVELYDLIYNLCDDLSSDAYVTDVKSLGLEMWVKALLHELDVFKTLLSQRTASQPAKGERHLSTSRTKAEKALRDLRDRMNAALSYESLTDCNTFVDSMNKLTQFYKQTVIASNKRSDTMEQNRQQKSDQPASESDSTPAADETQTDQTDAGQDITPETQATAEA